MLNRLNNQLNIMPEKFYSDTLRKDFIKTLSVVKFDPILIKTVEEVMNRADGSSVNKEYDQLSEDLKPLATALLSKGYQKSNDFIRADKEEKDVILKLTKDVQDLLMIIECTESPEKEEKKLSKERLNYDKNRKENIVKTTESVVQRQRIPNI